MTQAICVTQYQLNDNIVIEEGSDPEVLLVLFTGFANLLMIQPFEFLQVSGLYNYSRVLIRDPSQRMCLGGIGGEIDTFHKLMETIRQIQARLGAKRTIVIGSSGGAYTALLTAHFIDADYAHAFSPFPYTSPTRLLAMMDLQMMARYFRQIIKINLVWPVRKYRDLGKVLNHWNGHTKYYVHVCRHTYWDYRRARYLYGLPNVELLSYPCNQHAVIRHLARQKLLNRLFDINNQADLSRFISDSCPHEVV